MDSAERFQRWDIPTHMHTSDTLCNECLMLNIHIDVHVAKLAGKLLSECTICFVAYVAVSGVKSQNQVA